MILISVKFCARGCFTKNIRSFKITQPRFLDPVEFEIHSLKFLAVKYLPLNFYDDYVKRTSIADKVSTSSFLRFLRLISFHPKVHKGVNVANFFCESLKNFLITNKIEGITVDNASVNTTFLEELEAKFDNTIRDDESDEDDDDDNGS